MKSNTGRKRRAPRRVGGVHGSACLNSIRARVTTSAAALSLAVFAMIGAIVDMAIGPRLSLGTFGETARVILTAVGALTGAAVMAGLTWWLTGRALRTVKATRMQIAEITMTDLSLRIPEPAGHDEIALLARTVNRTLARLEEAVKQQLQFAANTSHELRTPLTSLRTRLEEALLYPGEVDPRETIAAALPAIDRLEAVINDLLMLARVRGGDTSAYEPIDLGALVEEEVATQATGVPVRTRVCPDVQVRGSQMQLIRMLDNLLVNAQRHAATAVEITAECVNGQAVVTVTDDGAGVPPQDRERIFERFIRLEDGRDRDPGGTGLGLAIARDIAHTHQGSLRIEDSPQGACFVLRLPLFEHRMEPVQSRAAPESVRKEHG